MRCLRAPISEFDFGAHGGDSLRVVSMSRTCGTFSRMTGSSVSRAAAIAGSAAFFAPLIRTVPSRGFPPRITNLSIRSCVRRADGVGRCQNVIEPPTFRQDCGPANGRALRDPSLTPLLHLLRQSDGVPHVASVRGANARPRRLGFTSAFAITIATGTLFLALLNAGPAAPFSPPRACCNDAHGAFRQLRILPCRFTIRLP